MARAFYTTFLHRFSMRRNFIFLLSFNSSLSLSFDIYAYPIFLFLSLTSNMSTPTSESMGEEEFSLKRDVLFKRTTLVRCVARVILCFYQFLGVVEVKELKDQYHTTVREMYKKFGLDENDPDPDDVLSSFVLTYLRNDTKNRFDLHVFTVGTKARLDDANQSVADIHKDALGTADHDFYVFSICMFKKNKTGRDDGFTVIGLCADQVFFDDNSDDEQVRVFNVRDTKKKLGVDPEEIMATSVFTMEMNECNCGCHPIIQKRVNQVRF